ncbi:MAG: hypothetical protein AAFV53_29185 [Myxococcota bacterium]
MIGLLGLLNLAGAAPTARSAGYVGELVTHPGLFAAAENTIWHQAAHTVVLGRRFGAFYQHRRHVALFARAEAGYRVTARSGLFVEGFAGVGGQHTILTTAVYADGADGVERASHFGQLTVAPHAAIGGGVRLRQPEAAPLRIVGRLEGWIRAPVNRRWLPGVAVQVGVVWTPKART